MKNLKYFIVLLLLSFSFVSGVSAGFFDNFIGNGAPDIRYCDQPGECDLQSGVDYIKNSLTGVETERSFSQYIQDIVIYLIGFISLIAVLYIIYAGFMILTWNGEDEKIKKSKQTILYVVIGIAVIWLAWPLTQLIINIVSN